MLIDCSYFTTGVRHIKNATLGTIQTNVAKDVHRAISGLIDEMQEEYLKQMLSDHLGNRVHTYLVCLDESENAKRIPAFDAVCEHLRESFADYVFFYFMRYAQTEVSHLGHVALKGANPLVSPIRKQTDAWNRMVKRNMEFVNWAQSDDCPLKGIETSANLLVKINQFNI